MAEKLTAARPYAEAVFALARAQDALPAWSGMLALAAAVAGDARIGQLASDPRVARARLLGLFLDICGGHLDTHGANFIRLLVENRRLNLLPEIATVYEGLRAEAEARVEATVTSAFSLEPAQLKVLEQGLQRRLGCAVHLTAAVDRSLVGGVVLRAGDLVIDGSVRGRLAALATELRH
ncbi:MAG: F0F1 ATP synthase subunit delta [Gammaproteobacteria bacterium]|nr:F0F1 ATP synthase subunit delta [Gammaproteobacteria bacterium]